MENLSVHQSQNFSQFSCAMSKCKETCCSNWSVEIDKETYLKYMQIEDLDFKSIMSNGFKKYNFFKSSKLAYGKFILNESNNCPFLDEKKLCTIHLKYGPENLSSVCNTFPRITNKVDGRLEQSLSIACSEAARLVLLDKTPFVISNVQKQKSDVPLINRTFNSNAQYIKKFNTYAILNRDLTIETLSNQEYRLFEKLLFLGNYFKDISILIYNKKLSLVPEEISNFKNRISRENLDKIVKETQAFQDIGIVAIHEIFSGLRVNNATSKNYMYYYENTCKGLKLDIHSSTQETILANYKSLQMKHSQVFEDKFEYIIQNYLIHYTYTFLFPFIVYGTVFDGFIILATIYALLKYKLIGLYEENPNLTEEDFAYSISFFAKMYTHNNNFNLNVLKFFRSSHLNNFQNLGGIIQI